MKTILRLVAVAFAVTALACGCATDPSQSVYAALGAAKDTENAAMDAYYALYWTGKVSAASEVKIVKLDADFQIAYRAAVKVARQDYRLAPVQAIQDAATAVVTAVNQIRATP